MHDDRQDADNAITVEGDGLRSAEVEKKHQCTVSVTYDGRTKPFDVNLDAATQALLQRAIREFGIVHQPHVLSLWTASGRELADQASLESQGVHCGETLLLRPGAVKGGAR